MIMGLTKNDKHTKTDAAHTLNRKNEPNLEGNNSEEFCKPNVIFAHCLSVYALAVRLRTIVVRTETFPWCWVW